MTLDSYNYIRKQYSDIHEQIQNIPVSDDEAVERIVIALEKLNNLVMDVANANRSNE